MNQRAHHPGPDSFRGARQRATSLALLDTDGHRYRTLYNAIDEGFCIVHVLFDGDHSAVDFRFLEVNPAFEKQSGLSGAVGRTMRELVPDQEQNVFEVIGRVADSGIPERFVQHSAALARWFDVFAFRVGDDRTAQVAVLFTDISLRKRSEVAMREREESFRALADASPAMIWITDRAARCTFVSRVWSEFTGLSRNESLGEGWLSALHPEDKEPSARAFTEANAQERPLEMEYRLRRRKDGSYRWCIARGRPRYSASGDYIGYVGLVLDVTERTLAERALRDAQTRLEATLEAGEVATWTWDIPGDRVYADRNLAHLFDVTPEEASGGPLEAYMRAVHPADRERVRASVHAAAAQGLYFEEAYRVRNADHQYRSVVARGRVECAPDGTPALLPGVILDVTRQENVEAQLQASEQRYRNLFNTIDEGFCVLEKVEAPAGAPLDFRYVEANPALASHSGLGNVLGKTLREVFGDDTDNWSPTYDAVLTTGTSVRFERELSGLDRVLEVYAFRVQDESRRRVGVIFKDISARKHAERELRVSEERFRTLVGQVKDYAIFRTDCEGRATSWNEGVRRVLGFEEQEFLGVDVAARIYMPADFENEVHRQELHDAVLNDAADNGRWMRKKDGRRFWAVGATTALRDEDGTLIGFTKVLRDQTEAHNSANTTRFLADASAALVELVDYRSTLQRIANLAVGGFADWCLVDIVDAEGQRRIAGARPTEERGSGKRHDEDWPASEHDVARLSQVLHTGRSELVPNVAHAKQTTSAFHAEYLGALEAHGVVSYICAPFLARGQVLGSISFLSDGSGRHYNLHDLRAAEDLAARISVALENARLYQAMQESDRRKDEFLATLAHELRNPLAPVRTGLHVLQMPQASPHSCARALQMMDRQLSHMVRLIDDLLDISRVSRGKVALRRERVKLQDVIENAIETSRPAIDAAHHVFAVTTPTEPIWLDADLTRLAQVLSNILTNAAKYTPEAGSITLDARVERGATAGPNESAEWAVVSVSDSGVGLPREMLGQVFEMFAQVNKTLDRAQGGLGIGLALAKRLVEMHGGTIRADSPGVGQGSTFTLRLPMIARHVVDVRPGEAAPREETGEQRRILVVDDNQDGAEALALMLELSGHQTELAFDGLRALETARRYVPDVVFLDIGLPQLSGYDVARKIRLDPQLRDAVLVALTGWGSEDDKRRSQDAGFDFHLTKPVDAAAVENVLLQTVHHARPPKPPSP
ncbi:MAG: PAS domain S-box protein [Myxococcales bacterium]